VIEKRRAQNAGSFSVATSICDVYLERGPRIRFAGISPRRVVRRPVRIASFAAMKVAVGIRAGSGTAGEAPPGATFGAGDSVARIAYGSTAT
jgi:hypothetical protein